MPSSFTGSEFHLESVAQYALATVRVRFTQDPLAANPTGPNDGTNPANYSLSGPAPNAVLSVAPVFGDPQSVDLFLQQPLAPGLWTLTVASNVEMWDLTSILTPRIMSFTASALNMPEAVSAGALDDTAADILRKHLNTALVGPGWDALVQAMATGDDANWQLAEDAFDQLFKSGAGGLYLDRKSGDDGLVRPSNLGMPDDLFREYSIRATTGKLVENAILDILEVFYGSDSVRAHADSAESEPYVFQDQDDLQVLVDERDVVNVVFTTADFAVPGVAAAAEVAAAITRAFRVNGLSAYALANTDPTTGQTNVRIFSGALGLASAVRVTGGKAQYALRFPQFLDVFTGLPTWNVTFDAVTDTLRLSPNGSVDLSQLRAGDYMTLYGGEFNVGNRGTFVLTNVYYAYTPSLVQYVEVVDPTGFAQSVTQLSAASLNFFRPAKQTAYTDPTRAVIVACPGDGLDVSLPATSQAVGRGPREAAYVQQRAAVPVTQLQRVGTTVVAHVPGHGLSAGDSFFVDGTVPTYTVPTLVSASLPTLPANFTSLYATTNPAHARSAHAGVLLQDGRALVISGIVGASNSLTCELFTLTGPTVLTNGQRQWTGTWSSAASLPSTAVDNHTATVLKDGRVLVVGGGTSPGGTTVTNKTWLYTPAAGGAGSWTAGPNLITGRQLHAAVLLDNGKVLVAGGIDNTTAIIASCELYDPVANSWSSTGTLVNPREGHVLVKLQSGDVLVVGGIWTAPSLSVAPCWTSEVYSSGSWSAAGNLDFGRQDINATVLPDGRVLVAGGYGQNPCQPTVPSESLSSSEIFDPSTKRWSRGPSLNIPRDTVTYALVGSRLYALGSGAVDQAGPDYTDRVEYMDLDEMEWKLSTASTPVGYDLPVGIVMNSEVVLLSGGYPFDGSSPAALVAVLESDTASARADGDFVVVSVVDADHFTYATPDSGYFLATGGTVTSMSAPDGIAGIPGPYVYDPLDGPGITDTSSLTSSQLTSGHQYAYVDVADAAQFPDEEGWLVFGFGYEYQVGPVRYLGRLSGTRLSLDFNFKFTATVPSGADVTLLLQKGPWVPDSPETVGSFYATGSAAGRVAAQAAVTAAVAAGVTVNEQVVYPGDRGLGNEGQPVEGVPKISDRVEIWAGDDVDAEVETARED